MRIALPLLLAAAPLAAAAAPRVVADIAPLHSLTARVAEGATAPTLLLPAEISPHDRALRPSQARMLQDADLVIWTGPALSPWLGEALENLAPEAAHLALGGGEASAQDARDDHDAAEGDDDAHAEGAEIHPWLDPREARAWLPRIAEALAAADPVNAALYRENAAEAEAELAALEAELDDRLAPVRSRPFASTHDAWGALAERFGLASAGALADVDAQRPGARRVEALRQRLRAGDVACLFLEPQEPDALARTAVEGTRVRLAALDPLGVGLAPGPDLYPELMRGIARALRDCLDAGRGATGVDRK
jgi:zinc transport system substrate-binding protein